MVKRFLIIFLMLLSLKAFSQENLVTLGGGYSFANFENTDVRGTGWRINGLYEFNPMSGKISHGISLGYITVSGTQTIGLETQKSTVNSVPIFYAPKIMFGNEKIKGFLKGALGMQFAGLKREGVGAVSDHDFGFYGGAGVGFMVFLKENIFFSGEYELAWLSNTWYKDGLMNTLGGGIGYKF
jgi:hypothetical protein